MTFPAALREIPAANVDKAVDRAQAKIVSEPEDKLWKLREFMAADLDDNLIRVFYDFGR